MIAMPLTDMKCRMVRPSPKVQKLSDGGGLQLWIQPTGGRLWRLAYRFDGKQKLLALGAYPSVSLGDARKARDDAKQLLRDGIDPSSDKKARKAEEEGETFRGIAQEYIARLERQGRADATITRTKRLLESTFPSLGALSLKDIDAPAVLKVLRLVEDRGHYETARRLRSTIGCIFRYAMVTARAGSDPTLALAGALIRPTVTPRAAITEPKAFGTLLRTIDSFEGQVGTRVALQLMALLFPRPGELRLAIWPEFDLDRAIWDIPASRMKMRRPHRVPLPRQAVFLLRHHQETTSAGLYLFPGIRTAARPISDGTLNAALRRLGYEKEEVTPHGFRATASTLLNECGKWHADAIERQLAHVENNDVRRAYARAEYWDERVRMMQWWADYLDGLKANPRSPSNKIRKSLPTGTKAPP
ncbi:symbiosis island integrase [Nitrospirillum viridazoti Y2]|nr:symbiosis island integrase [Nitrospirillum amazonense Y2]